jgi:hypothetical protein
MAAELLFANRAKDRHDEANGCLPQLRQGARKLNGTHKWQLHKWEQKLKVGFDWRSFCDSATNKIALCSLLDKECTFYRVPQ